MRLATYMQQHGLDDEEMARRVRTENLDCDRTQINKYRRGVIRPSWPVIARIKAVTGGAVTADDFQDLEPVR